MTYTWNGGVKDSRIYTAAVTPHRLLWKTHYLTNWL